MKKKIIATICLCVTSVFILYAQTNLQASVTRGKAVYAQYCLSCHQEDGSGVPKLNPPLISTSYVTGDKKKLIQWVLTGSKENVPIDGKYYSNNMAAQSNLSDQQIADVLTYVRNSFGNKATAVTPAEVKTVRAETK